MKKAIYTGYIFAALATIIWSGNFLIARGINEKISPVGLAFWRWTVATIVVLPFAVKPIYRNRSIIKSHFLYLLVTSVLGVSIFNTLIYMAGETSTSLNLSLISITFPVFTIILARIFLNEPITKAKVIGVFIIIFGVVLLVSKGDMGVLTSLSFAIGDLWMLLASLIFAVYSLLVKYKPEKLEPLSFLGTTFLLGLVFLAPFYFWLSDEFGLKNYDRVTLISILYVGIFASIIAYFLWNRSVDLIGPAKASMIYYTIPLFSGLLAFVVLGEEVMMLHFISGVCIVSGIMIAGSRT